MPFAGWRLSGILMIRKDAVRLNYQITISKSHTSRASNTWWLSVFLDVLFQMMILLLLERNRIRKNRTELL